MSIRANEKTYPDVGGGFVESHPRGDGIDWDEAYPHKGTEETQCMACTPLRTCVFHAVSTPAERGELGGISAIARGPSGAGAELERGSSGASSGALRGTSRVGESVSVTIHITPPDDERPRPRHTCEMHGLWLCSWCPPEHGGCAI